MIVHFKAFAATLSIALLIQGDLVAETFQGARTISFYGYDDCIRLENETVSATLCPGAGGRIIQYALDGRNVLYLPIGDEGWRWDGDPKKKALNAGRFDIGPEKIVPGKRLALWQGVWKAEITGDRSARLTSPSDPDTGVQLIRDFKLSAKSSRLACTQTIRNVSASTKEYCHWSRTFAVGEGVCIVPTSTPTRFPNHYIMYHGTSMNFLPRDPKIIHENGYLRIENHPAQPKLGMDSAAGILLYFAPNDLLFVKTYEVDTDRVYNEMAGLTVSIWYPERPMVEIEPIGPRERLAPGEEASFTETWHLLPQRFDRSKPVDVDAIRKTIAGDSVNSKIIKNPA